MPNRNTAEVMGHIGKDPETRFFENGRSVTSFSIATSNDYKDKNGEWIKKDPTWWNCKAWGELGEAIETALMKGDAVMVRGKTSMSTWQDKTGADRTSLELNVTEAYKPIYPRKDNQSPEGESVRTSKPRGHSADEADFPMDISEMRNEEDADIPF